jgi:hypothetical protein
MCWPFIDRCFMFLKRVNRSGIAPAASRASLRGGRLPRACGCAAPYPADASACHSRPEMKVGQLWGGDRRRRKPILGVMSSRMGPRCRKGSRFLSAANNASWFSASSVWPSRTKTLAHCLAPWGNKGYIPVFFISSSNGFSLSRNHAF